MEDDDSLELDPLYMEHVAKRALIRTYFNNEKEASTPKRIPATSTVNVQLLMDHCVYDGQLAAQEGRQKKVDIRAFIKQGLLQTFRESMILVRCRKSDLKSVDEALDGCLEEIGRKRENCKIMVDRSNFLRENVVGVEIQMRNCQLQSEIILLYEEIGWYKLAIQKQPLNDKRITEQLEDARSRLPVRIERIRNIMTTEVIPKEEREILRLALENLSVEMGELGRITGTTTGDCNVPRNVQKLDSYLNSDLFTLTSSALYAFQ